MIRIGIQGLVNNFIYISVVVFVKRSDFSCKKETTKSKFLSQFFYNFNLYASLGFTDRVLLVNAVMKTWVK